jgi:hypothetical protein
VFPDLDRPGVRANKNGIAYCTADVDASFVLQPNGLAGAVDQAETCRIGEQHPRAAKRNQLHHSVSCSGDVDEGAGARVVPPPGQTVCPRRVVTAGKQAPAVLRPRDSEVGVIEAADTRQELRRQIAVAQDGDRRAVMIAHGDMSPVGRERNRVRPVNAFHPSLRIGWLVIVVRRVKPHEPVEAGGNQAAVAVEINPVSVVAVVAVARQGSIPIAGVEDANAV